ncbi:class E sortase [Kitasatospora albolonga]|uniref:class E sortase n=1 Tax=Kitasatospora albolonga TaxID=68173 RepID=UPI0035F0EA8B
MTAVRPEGRAPDGADGGPGDWGVYEQAAPPSAGPGRDGPGWGGQPPHGPGAAPYGPGGASHGQGAPHGQDAPYGRGGAPYGQPGPVADDSTMQLRVVPDGGAVLPPPGRRADRRRTTVGSGNGRRRAAGRPATPVARPPERKRVVAARVLGELFITLGLVMLLFVSYQLWWTNVQADNAASGERDALTQQWDQAAGQQGTAPASGAAPAPQPTAFEPGKGFAIIHIPKLGLTYPIAEGTDKQKVLDKGLVGHYTGTAMPTDKAGNFAVAAHRTTHGQPFRKIGELVPGDSIVVETATAYYTYQVAGGIPETPPTNVSVIRPIPNGSPFKEAGRYITLTTCTPEFSARGRLIVFGKMVEEKPRSQGQPAALAG